MEVGESGGHARRSNYGILSRSLSARNRPDSHDEIPPPWVLSGPLGSRCAFLGTPRNRARRAQYGYDQNQIVASDHQICFAALLDPPADLNELVPIATDGIPVRTISAVQDIFRGIPKLFPYPSSHKSGCRWPLPTNITIGEEESRWRAVQFSLQQHFITFVPFNVLDANCANLASI